MIQEDQQNLSQIDKQKCSFKDNIYYKTIHEHELYTITENLTTQILHIIHKNYGHIGTDKTWKIFRETYYNRHDRVITKNIIKRCNICQLGKEKNFHCEGTPKSIIAKQPLHIIAVDFITNITKSYQGNKNIFIIIDIFSKFIKTYPCKRTNVKTVKTCLQQFIDEFGKPQVCILDNATYFKSQRFKNFTNERNIKLNFISIRHPNSNPTERYIKECNKYLRMMVHNEHPRWEEKLIDVEYFINNIPNSITNVAPITLFQHVDPDRPWIFEHSVNYDQLLIDVNKRLIRNAEKYIKRKTKKKLHEVTFNKGDLVIVKSLRIGPYMINNQNGINSYELIDMNTGKLR
ncbi:hypothetical protein NQ317_003913, partial [Molorchus minor]